MLPSMAQPATPPRRAYLERLVRKADEDDNGEGDVCMSPDKSKALVHLLRLVSLDLEECKGMEVSAAAACGPSIVPQTPVDPPLYASASSSAPPFTRDDECMAAAAASLTPISPSKRIRSKQEDILSEPVTVWSPAKRINAKESVPLVLKRRDKYCIMPDRVFNRQSLGQPARKVEGQEYCVWCDSSLMQLALQEDGFGMNVKVSLACFKKSDTADNLLAV